MMKFKQWRLIKTGVGTADWNMAVDEALLQLYDKEQLPILRLYGWEPSLSLGRFSKQEQIIDMQLVKDKKIPYVRRITGGGVLVHGDDLSYALIVPGVELSEYGVKEHYRMLCRFLIHLYEGFGYTPHFAIQSSAEVMRSEICLAGNEPYDITINGQKIGGNAQRHRRCSVMQHGTIPMGFDKELFDPLFKVDSGLENAASLKGLGTAIGFDALSRILTKAFEEVYETELIADSMRQNEIVKAQELLECKYSQVAWNRYGRY